MASRARDNNVQLQNVKTREDTEPGLQQPLSRENSIDTPCNAVPSSLPREIAMIATLCTAQLFTQAAIAMSLQPLHIIGASFQTTDAGELSWYVAAYSLTVGTFILPAGRLGDLYGHKRFFVMGALWFGLWSLLAGVSVWSDGVFFDVCRAMQGIGPAFMLPNAVAILGRTYKPGRKQEMIFSVFGATAPSGYVVGAVFSSLLAQRLWWPWAYWIMCIACVLLAIAGMMFIPSEPRPVFEDSAGMLSRVDFAGSVTGVTGLVLINFAWNQAPIVGWQMPYIYVLLILGFTFMGGFAIIESRARFPLVPFDHMNTDVGFVLGCIALGWSSFGIWLYYAVQILEVFRGASPLLVSGMMGPLPLSGICAALTTGYILRHVPVSLVMVVSMFSFSVGIILIGTMPVEQSYWIQTFISFIIMPWGMDMSWPAATIILSNALPHEHQGLAASLVNTVVNYSVSLGLGFAGTVEVHVDDRGAEVLKGYRGALHMGIGLACLGAFTSVMFMLSTLRIRRQPRKESKTNP
ncbi:major facilitator superfamily transporter [Bisporella sp. PMI_857]|nr:major facilitator superfamily transporter [Bisporella sp. PMI_857]